MADCMVLVHAPTRQTIGDTPFDMPSLSSVIALHESLMAPLNKSRVAAIGLNTVGFETPIARDIIERVKRETGLPVSDPVRFGAGEILDAVFNDMKQSDHGGGDHETQR